MITIEKYIHDLIGNYPAIRKPLVLIYQWLFYFIPTKCYINAEVLTVKPGYFFGFHDKCPWSYDDTMLLAHKYEINKPLSSVEKLPVNVGYFTGLNFDKFTSIGTTEAWNWQQGSSLQWMGNNRQIIYNDIKHGLPISRIYDIDTGLYKEIDLHIMSVSNDGMYAACCSFDRFGNAMPGYGYPKLKPSVSLNDPLPEDEAIIILRMIDFSIINKFRLRDIIHIDSTIQIDTGYHFFSHCLFSPDSKRIAFFFRSLQNTGKLQTRLFSAGIHGEDIWRHPGELHSHISWMGNNSILSYCVPFGSSWGFYIHNEFSDSVIPVGPDDLTSDGHPQVSNDGRYVLVDTYPDRSRNQRLKIYDTKEDRCTFLLCLRIPFKFRNARRCDFHPRWNRNNELICFDSTHTGVRSLCLIKNPLEF